MRISDWSSDVCSSDLDRDVWVFGYGSLMWNPGFAFLERQPALLRGYHRAFCIYSEHYRGTRERPGLVLWLDRGGSCRGIAFRVAQAAAPEVLGSLWDREVVTSVYAPRTVALWVGGRRIGTEASVEIGRASGRVRVCQFVCVSVGGDTIK